MSANDIHIHSVRKSSRGIDEYFINGSSASHACKDEWRLEIIMVQSNFASGNLGMPTSVQLLSGPNTGRLTLSDEKGDMITVTNGRNL